MTIKKGVGICIGALIILLFAFIFWQLAKFMIEDEPSSFSFKEESAPSQKAAGKEKSLFKEPEKPVRQAPKEKTQEKTNQEDGKTILSGKVTELGSGMPVTRFEFDLLRRRGKSSSFTVVINKKKISNKKGRFSFVLTQGGNHSIVVRASCNRTQRLDDLNIQEGVGISDIHIELDPGLAVSGTVVEDSSDQPIAGALVVGNAEYPTGFLESVLLDQVKWHSIYTKTDKAGNFTLRGIRRSQTLTCIAAVHPDFAISAVEESPGTSGIVIRLKPGLRVFGNACDDEGVPRRGILVSVKELFKGLSRPVLTDSNGNYRSAPLLPGWVEVKAKLPLDGKSWKDGGKYPFVFSPEDRSAKLVDRDVEVNFGPIPEHVTWRGRLLDHNQNPVSGWITVYPKATKIDHSKVNGEHNYEIDKSGYFEVRKLVPGTYGVFLFPSGNSPFHDFGEFVIKEPGLFEKDLQILD